MVSSDSKHLNNISEILQPIYMSKDEEQAMLQCHGAVSIAIQITARQNTIEFLFCEI